MAPGESIEIWRMRAFTDRPFSGNPAGVVLNGDALTTELMQQLAPELNNISETVYVCSPEDESADLRLRYFTTTTEVDLCGHATIAAMFALAASGRLKKQSGNRILRAETISGVLDLGLEFDSGQLQRVTMNQPKAQHQLPTHPELAALVLGLSQAAVSDKLTIACCHTGIWSCYVPLVSLEALGAIQVQHEKIEGIWPENENFAGIYPFVITDQPESPNQLGTQGRFFCPPKFGIAEDPVTGTATGALAAYLMENGLLAPQGVLEAVQGVEMGCPGRMQVRRSNEGTIQISGQAVAVYRGQLLL